MLSAAEMGHRARAKQLPPLLCSTKHLVYFAIYAQSTLQFFIVGLKSRALVIAFSMNDKVFLNNGSQLFTWKCESYSACPDFFHVATPVKLSRDARLGTIYLRLWGGAVAECPSLPLVRLQST